MKKLVLYVLLTLAVLAAILTYVLYTEGAFETYEPTKQSDLEPFMKCEAGKCAPGKCGANSK
jgi:hypothetical protein